MFHILKQTGRLVHFFNFLLLKNQRLKNVIRPYSYFVNYSSQIALCGAGQNKGFLISNDRSGLIVSRDKHSSRKKKPKDEESSDEEDTDEDDDDSGEYAGEGADVKTYNVKSLRMDGVLKTILRTSRKNIEMNFYENRIRVNRKTILKKSQNVKVNDVIDIIKGVAPDSNMLVVGQVKILKIQPEADTGVILMEAWKCKSIEVENYEGANAWRDQQQEDNSL